MNSTLNLKGRKVVLHDMCLRDGMHAKREQISVEQMVKVGTALDEAGMPYIQVTHGAGLGGNSLQHGFALASNEEYINAVASRMKQAKISILLVQGLGTMRELQSAYDAGGARHCGGDREVKWADLIIFNFPIYWYSMPAILKAGSTGSSSQASAMAASVSTTGADWRASRRCWLSRLAGSRTCSGRGRSTMNWK